MISVFQLPPRSFPLLMRPEMFIRRIIAIDLFVWQTFCQQIHHHLENVTDYSMLKALEAQATMKPILS